MSRQFRWASLCVLCLVLALVLLALPAAAQMSNRSDRPVSETNSDIYKTSNSGGVIPGTGMTAEELRDRGYSDNEIALIRSEAPGAMASEQATTNESRQAGTNTAGTTGGTSSGGWGLWGLVGLLGLLGLARGRRVETVRRPEDIRRVA